MADVIKHKFQTDGITPLLKCRMASPTSLEGIQATKKGRAVSARGTQNMAQKIAPHQTRAR
jgi:hypothetical protein